MKETVFTLIVVLTVTCLAKSARILGVFPMPAPSHYILGSALMRGLAEKGHDVTVISPFGEKDPPKNGTYRVIVVENVVKLRQEFQKNIGPGGLFEREDSNPFISSIFVSTILSKLLNTVLKEENVQKLVNSNEHFDVVIVEQFINDHQKILAAHFKAPLILFCTGGASFWINPLVGNPAPPSYISDVLLEYTNPMSFGQRLMNTLKVTFDYLFYYFVVFPTQNELAKVVIPGNHSLYDSLYNASLVLLNSHPSTNLPVPYVPNMIDIGGFHIKPPKKLPEDLQKFLDEAAEGVIYFSLGSNLRSADLPAEKRDAILRSFAKLKLKVLWKWEEDVLPGQPPNVKLGKWLPQQDILAHPNVKLFITHGGLLSTTEAVYHGVPLLAIPIFGDQKMNAKAAVNRGFGVMLNYRDISEETFSMNINGMLNDPKYKENAKMRSKIFHDRPMSPMDSAIYWVEYVIRHKGAPHLRVAGLDLPWYKYLLLDVIAFVTVIIVGVLLISRYIIKWLFKKCCATKQIKVKRN